MTVFQEITKSRVSGCFLIRPWIRKDARGSFVKTFHAPTFQGLGLETDFREDYYSVSQQGVLRGMHFQRPPHQHAKLVYCAHGSILDAVVDLRSGTPGFGAHEVFPLSSENGCLVYVPAGVAHGFFVLSEEAITVYKVTSEYDPETDDGVRWDSCGIEWPTERPLLSPRDNAFRKLSEAADIFSESLHG